MTFKKAGFLCTLVGIGFSLLGTRYDQKHQEEVIHEEVRKAIAEKSEEREES